jgi:hypothetical protein
LLTATAFHAFTISLSGFGEGERQSTAPTQGRQLRVFVSSFIPARFLPILSTPKGERGPDDLAVYLPPSTSK